MFVKNQQKTVGSAIAMGVTMGKCFRKNFHSKTFQKKAIKVNDCVKILCEPYKGYYAIVISQSYGDEWEIQYFKK